MILTLKDKELNKYGEKTISGKGFNWSWLGLNDNNNKKDAEIFKDIADMYKKGSVSSDQFNTALSKLSKTGKETASEIGKTSKTTADVSLDFQKASENVKKIEPASRAAAVGMTLLTTAANMFISFGISAAISLIVQGIQSFANAASEAVQKAQEASQKYTDSSTNLEGYKKNAAEIQEALTSGNLSFEETKAKRQELMEIQNQLIGMFGNEKGAIDDITGALQGQAGAWERLEQFNYQQWELEANKPGGWGQPSGLQQAINYMEEDVTEKIIPITLPLDLYYSTDISDEVGEKITDLNTELVKRFNLTDLYDSADASESIYGLTGTPEEVYDKLSEYRKAVTESVNDVFSESGVDQETRDSYLEDLTSPIDEKMRSYSEKLKKHEETYNIWLKNKISTDSQYSDHYGNLLKSKVDYEDAIAIGDPAEIEKSIGAYTEAYNAALASAGDDSNIKSFYEKLFPEMSKVIEKSRFEKALKIPVEIDFDNGKTKKKQTVELAKYLKAITDEELYKQEWSGNRSPIFNAIIDQAIQSGIITDKSYESISSLIDLLANSGYILSNFSSNANTISQAFNNVKKSTENSTLTLKLLNDTLNSQNTGVGITLEQYEALIAANKDYAGCLEYNNGVMQINTEKAKSIADADIASEIKSASVQLELAGRQYDANNDKLETLKNQYNSLSDAQSKEKSFKKDKIDQLEAEQTALEANINKYSVIIAQLKEVNGAYQEWKNSQNVGESGDMFTDTISAKNQLQEGRENGRIGTKKYKAALDLLIPDTVDPEDGQAVQDYIHKLERYMTVNDKGEKTVTGMSNFLDDSIEKGLIEEAEDGLKTIVEGVNMDDFCRELNITPEMARAIFGELEEYGFDFDWTDEFKDSMKLTVSEISDYTDNINKQIDSISNKAIKTEYDKTELQSLYGQLYDINALKNGLNTITSVSVKAHLEIEDQLKEAQENLDSLKKSLAEDPENIEIQADIDQAEIAIGKLKIDKESLAQPTDAEINLSITETDLTLKGLYDKRNELNGTDITQKYKIQAELGGASFEETQGILNGKIAELESQETTLKVMLKDEYTSELEKCREKLTELSNMTATPQVLVDIYIALSSINYLEARLAEVDGKSATVTTNHVTNYETYRRTGGEQNPAYVNGNAYANGNQLLAKSQSALERVLIGELGPEMIVDPNTGRWYTVGNYGAEFVNIPSNTIVFNHLQTRDILENGYVAGRAKSLKGGTAFVSGGGYLPDDNPGVGDHYGGGGSGGSSGSNNDNNYTPSNNNSSNNEKKDKPTTFDWIERALKKVQRAIDLFVKSAENVFRSFTSRTQSLESQYTKMTEKIKLNSEAYSGYMKEANSVGLSDEYKNKIKNGTIDIESVTDEDLKERISDYKEWYDKALEVKDANVDLKRQLSEIAAIKFENINTLYEGKTKQRDIRAGMYDSLISLAENKGQLVTGQYYAKQRNLTSANVDTMQAQRKKMNDQLNSMIKSGDITKGSEKYNELRDKILEIDASILVAKADIAEFNNLIRQAQWEKFDLLQEKIGQVTQESEFLLNILDENDFFNKDTGQATNTAKAAMGLHNSLYTAYQKQALMYKDEITKINAQLAKDPNNQKLIDRKNELIGAQQQSIEAAKQEKLAAIDLKRKGYEAQLEVWQKLVDKKKEALDVESGLRDYQKDVISQTEKIAMLQKQLRAYSQDGSEESRQKVQELKVSLKEAEDKLKETEYQKYIEDQKNMLDDIVINFEANYNEKLGNIDALFKEIIADTNKNAAVISETIKSAAKEVGYSLSTPLKDIWASNNPVSMFMGKWETSNASTITVINQISKSLSDMYKKMEAAQTAASKAEDKSSGNAGSANPPKKPTKPPTPTGGTGNSGESAAKKKPWIKKKDEYPKHLLDKNYSIVDRLKYFDFDSSFNARKKYYSALGGKGSYQSTADQNVWLISQMKKQGYSKGGTIGSLIKPTGEDGFILARTGEEVLSIPKLQLMRGLTADMDRVMRLNTERLEQMYNNSAGSISTDIQNVSQPSIGLNITIESMNLPNVKNSKEFSSNFIGALQESPDMRKAISTFTVNNILGKNQLEINKFRR